MGEPERFNWRRMRRRAVIPLALTLPGAARLLPAIRPLPWHETRHPAGNARDLLVFLPGIGELPGDFQRRGFVDAAWRAGLNADVLEPDLHAGYFYRGIAIESLHEDLIRAARARGYERIWLVGLSLGGFGTLRYLQAHGESVDGAIVLAPAVGRGTVSAPLWEAMRDRAELPGAAGQALLWEWLPHRSPRPPLYLAFGDSDPFAPALRLATELLPKGHVFSTPGGHNWPTWSRLWTTLLSRVFTQPRHV